MSSFEDRFGKLTVGQVQELNEAAKRTCEFETTSCSEPHLTNTKQLNICQHCGVMTFTLMDEDGNRYCGKCKQPKQKGDAKL